MCKNASVISKACTGFAFYKFSDLAEAVVEHRKVEQVTLHQHVAQGHKKDTWLCLPWGTGLLLSARVCFPRLISASRRTVFGRVVNAYAPYCISCQGVFFGRQLE